MNQDPTILDELSRLSQHVAALQKHTPFSIPHGYFEQFPESLKSKIRSLEIESELASISPLLDKMDRKMPFELPENYFETKQFNQPEASKQPIGKVIRFRRWFSYAAAASVLLMVMLTVLNKRNLLRILFLRRTALKISIRILFPLRYTPNTLLKQKIRRFP